MNIESVPVYNLLLCGVVCDGIERQGRLDLAKTGQGCAISGAHNILVGRQILNKVSEELEVCRANSVDVAAGVRKPAQTGWLVGRHELRVDGYGSPFTGGRGTLQLQLTDSPLRSRRTHG